MIRKLKITLLLFGFSLAAFSQQQTVFSNFLVYQYLYNPAYAGVIQGTQFNVGYRNQWQGFEGAPKTIMVSGYGTMKKKPNMTIGGSLITERIGLLQINSFMGSYSYHLKINKKADISFGLGLGMVQHNVKVYDSRPYDKDDAFLSSPILNGYAFDANSGVYFYTKKFFFGFSDQHMPNSKILWSNSTGKLTQHFYAYTGYNFNLDSKKEWILQPSILARTNSPAPYQLEAAIKAMYRQIIWAGISYRQKSAACFMLGCNIEQQFSFAYSYDLTLTALNNYSSGSHEILLGYLIPFKKKKSKSDLVKDADEEELNKIDNTLKTNLRNKKKKSEDAEKPEETKPEGENKTATSPVIVPPAETNTETPAVNLETPKEGNVEKPKEPEPKY